jgi:hypothetical protein
VHFPAKQKGTTPGQTASILVGGSVIFAIWIVVAVSLNAPHQTANLHLMIVLLSGIATALLCGLLSESQRRAQRELDLAAKQAKLEATNLQLEESKQRAEQASAAKSLFLANMSHEQCGADILPQRQDKERYGDRRDQPPSVHPATAIEVPAAQQRRDEEDGGRRRVLDER